MTEIEKRKQDHINICANQDVEHGYTYLNEIQLIPQSLPELALSDIDTTCSFLKKKTAAPIFISCMTGGSADGAQINARLAEAAEEVGIALGLGSIRILFEQESLIKDFQVRDIAPNIPIFANLSAGQLRNIKHGRIIAMLETLEVDAIALHLNPAQELSQFGGDEDFCDLIENISTFISVCPMPVIVKETGFGILPTDAKRLLGYGAKYVDIAGSGGTNWSKIEHIRNLSLEDNKQSFLQQDIYELGTPTSLLMLGLYKQKGILASGGIRSALDIVRCLVLGAEGVGLALPIFKRAILGTEETIDYLQTLIMHVAKTMLLCGAKDISETRKIPFYLGQFLQNEFMSFSQTLKLRVPKDLQSKIHVYPR